MSREKQIEEMAKLACTCFEGNCKGCPFDFYPPCPPKASATRLYNAGYRKQSEVIEEFANRLKEKLYTVPTVYNAHFRKMVDAIVTEMKGAGE